MLGWEQSTKLHLHQRDRRQVLTDLKSLNWLEAAEGREKLD